MSWEVLTMRSATSFFNLALARSDLRRYWPALFLYVGLWIIFLPVQLWLMAVSYTHLRAHETKHDLVCRLLLEKKKKNIFFFFSSLLS